MSSTKHWSLRAVIPILSIAIGLVFGDLVMAALAYASSWAVVPFTHGWPALLILGLRWLITGLLITAAGYALALPTMVAYRQTDTAVAPPPPDKRLDWSKLALERGLYVLASLIGGAPGVAWWYAPRRDRHLRIRVLGAAAILGFTMSAFWIGLFDAHYRWWAVGVLVTLVILLLLSPVIRSQRKVPRNVS